MADHLSAVASGYLGTAVSRTVVDDDELETLSERLVSDRNEALVDPLGSVEGANDDADAWSTGSRWFDIHVRRALLGLWDSVLPG
jgi:hypothetical protein